MTTTKQYRTFNREYGFHLWITPLQSDKITSESLQRFCSYLVRSAVNDYLTYSSNNKLFVNAKLWLFDSEDYEEGNSNFVSCLLACNILDVDVDRLRFVLNHIKDSRSKGNGKWISKDEEFEDLLQTCY